MKQSYVIAGALVVAVALWLLSGLLDRDAPSDRATGEVPADEVVSVQVRALEAEPHMRTRAVFGRTEADRRVNVRVETAGRVVAKTIEKGSVVREGDLVLELAPDDRPARLKEAEALVEQRRVAHEASMSLSKSGFRSPVTAAETAAAYEAARAMLAAVRLDIERTRVKAPIAGVVDDVPVEVGDYVETGDPAFTMVDLDPIKIAGEVSERDVGLIQPGSRAAVRLITGPILEGTIRYVSRTALEGTRTFRVEVEAANPAMAIGAGITAEIVLPLGVARAHRVSPAILTLNDAGEVGVKAVDEDRRVLFLPVTIVDDSADGVWLEGLPERVTLITVGQEFVRAGETVRPVPALVDGMAERPRP